MEQTDLEQLINKLVSEKLAEQIDHTCFNCTYFGFKPTGLRNRLCLYPEPIMYDSDCKNGECQKWSLQPDPSKRKKFFTTWGVKKQNG